MICLFYLLEYLGRLGIFHNLYLYIISSVQTVLFCPPGRKRQISTHQYPSPHTYQFSNPSMQSSFSFILLTTGQTPMSKQLTPKSNLQWRSCNLADAHTNSNIHSRTNIDVTTPPLLTPASPPSSSNLFFAQPLKSFLTISYPVIALAWPVVNPMETITKFTGYNYPPPQLFLETKNSVKSREPTLGCPTPEFSQKFVQHIAQRLGHSVLEISEILKGLKTFSPTAWTDFKAEIRHHLGRLSSTKNIFKLKSNTLSKGDLASLCAKVRMAVNNNLSVLGSKTLGTALEQNENAFKVLTAKTVLYSSL